MRREYSQYIGFFALRLCMWATLASLAAIIFFILSRGMRVMSWEFITQPPRMSMTAGGIAPAIVGTVYLTLGAILVALPLGVACAVYLCEYSPRGIIGNIIRISINNLAGVPSVVFGLFGLAVFVKLFNFGVSILSGSLTLGILTLPLIISSAQEALLAVPVSIREASFSVGATRWETIRRIVLPYALPGILTGVILSIGRVIGETAPIIFTAAAFYLKGYPKTIFSEVMALPYHIYALMTEGTHPEKQEAIAYGCALVLLIVVLSISSLAVVIRERQRRKYA
jgi:phosphate transport system permease protein